MQGEIALVGRRIRYDDRNQRWPGLRLGTNRAKRIINLVKKQTFTMALERHDRHVPFFMGAVKPPDGVEIVPLEIGVGNQSGRRDGQDRHGRMFRDHEFDICEQSLSSYIIAKSQGATFTAAPVFPRRLFSQSCMFVNCTSDIETPADLSGKRVGILSFQTTLCVQAKGDLKQEFGVAWQDIDWFVQQAEELTWESGGDASINQIANGRNACEMLVEGELDAVFLPNPPPVVLESGDRVKQLFGDPKTECVRYFRKHGYCPIMHLMVFSDMTVDAAPWLPRATINMCDEATRLTYGYYEDPNYSLLLFARNELEIQHEVLGNDPWQSGLTANRANLERFIDFMVDQLLIDAPISIESLFHSSVLDT
jgi:4,5-dihydroxyphthalate decarboxylase